MSVARPVHENASLMITRRVRDQQFLLHPCKKTDDIVRYVVAAVAQRYEILLHAIVALSDHWHICLTDPQRRVCDFTRDAHSTIARALNVEYGDSESLWSSQQTSHVVCVEPKDLVDKMVYTMANPVKARLVQRGENWPGIRGAWPARPMMVERRGKFFRHANRDAWPDTVVLEFARPPGYEGMSDEELGEMLEEAIEVREAGHREEAKRKGERFMGQRRLQRRSRYSKAASRRKKRDEKGRKISPRVACKDRWLRIARLAMNRAWLEAYQAALRRWRAGDREVEFPHGTYKMRVLHGARCAGPPN